jgi:hypothetical protein
MGIGDELQHIQDLHEQGALTEQEFSDAKSRAIGGTLMRQADDIADLQRRQSTSSWLEQIDRDWNAELQEYLVRGRGGTQIVPTKSMAVRNTLPNGIVGITLLVVAAFFHGISILFPILGLSNLMIGIGLGMWIWSKAQRYDNAFASYLHRRNALTDSRGTI